MKYAIKYGLGGGFGGIESMTPEIIKAGSYDKAMDFAYEKAVDEYHSHSGRNGLHTVASLMEENPEYTEEEAEDALNEEIERWIQCEAILIENQDEKN